MPVKNNVFAKSNRFISRSSENMTWCFVSIIHNPIESTRQEKPNIVEVTITDLIGSAGIKSFIVKKINIPAIIVALS